MVVGSSDPNPLVAGKGIAILRSHGIEVIEHDLRADHARKRGPVRHGNADNDAAEAAAAGD